MSVNIIVSSTFGQAKKVMLERLRENNKAGTSHLVIVPDRYSLSYQRAVIEELNLRSVSNIEVVSFSRLADLYLDKDKRYLTPQSCVMIMRKAINRNRDKLLRYKVNAGNVGFADEMFAVVSDIRNSAITADMISAKMDNIKVQGIKQKTHDINLLYREYMSELESSYYDATSKMDALLHNLDKIDIIKNSYVYVCDYYKFTNVELKIMERIMELSSSVDISLVEKSSGTNMRIFPRLSLRLANLASRHGIKATKSVNGYIEDYNSLIYDNLFGYINDERKENGKDVVLRSAKNPEEEISYVAMSINKSIREGMRYRDIAIACSNVDVYKDVIEKIFRLYNIPYYVDDKLPILSTVSIRFILQALEIIAGGYKRSDVLAYLNNGINNGISLDDKDTFGNYLIKYNIDRKRLVGEFTINNGEDLGMLNGIRNVLFTGFDVLEANNIKQPMSAHIDGIMNYLDAVGYIDKVNELAKRQFDEGFVIESEVTKQAPKKLFRFFDELKMVARDEEISQKEFTDIMTSSLVRVSISLIPQFSDSVYIGDMSESRYDNVREMYFVGVSQDSVPRDSTHGGIMGIKENEVWSSLELNIEPTPKDKNMLARFYILELLLNASDRIYLTYPRCGIDDEVKTPSIVIKQLSEIYGQKIISVSEDFDNDLVSYYSTYANARRLAAINYSRQAYTVRNVPDKELGIAKYLYDNNQFIPFDYKDEDNIEYMSDVFLGYNDNRTVGRISASRIENYLKCPFAAYMEYGLKIKDREESKINVADAGSVIHGILEDLYRNKDNAELSREEVSKLIDNLFDKTMARLYPDILKDPDMARVVDDLRSRSRYVVDKVHMMLAYTPYRPYATEFRFENAVKKYNGKKYYLNGSIDRIDTYDSNMYIVDYKSSSSVEARFNNVYYGERIQLIIYLTEAMKTLKNYTPAGIFYLPMPAGYKKTEEVESAFGFSGIVNSECMDTMVIPGADRIVYPFNDKFKITKYGEVLDHDEMTGVIGYVERLIGMTLSEIDNGYIGKNPLEEHCKYCKYKSICNMYGNIVYPREMKKVKLDTLLLSEEENNG